jgi:predicted transcriptional regulator of viral defense system
MTTNLTTRDIAALLGVSRQMAHRIARRLAKQHGIERQGRDWLIPAEIVEAYKPAKVGHPKGENKNVEAND